MIDIVFFYLILQFTEANSGAGCPGRTAVAQLSLVPQLKFVQVLARI